MSLPPNTFERFKITLVFITTLTCLLGIVTIAAHFKAFAGATGDTNLMPAAGSATLMDVYGVSRAELVSWLQSHENDTYYLTTPYDPNDNRSPNGDINNHGEDSNGAAGMNCTGFVWHALCAAHGWRDNIASRLPAMSGWVNIIYDYALDTRNFASKQEMLASGYLEKGDIVWAWDGNMHTLSSSHHVGIFWGDSSSDDAFWHSEGAIVGGFWKGENHVTDVHGKASNVSYTVIKLGGSLYGSFEFTKVSALPSLTTNNKCYSLEGAVYGLFANEAAAQTHSAQAALKTYKTDATGRIKSSEDIMVGSYVIAECQAPRGYELNPALYPVKIEPLAVATIFDNDIQQSGKASDAPFFAPTTPLVAKHDIQTRSKRAQGGATFKDAVFTVSYYDGFYSTYNLPSRATRMWTMHANEAGEVIPDEQFKISGDALYFDSTERACLPLGTYVIQETVAPLGYLCGSTHDERPSVLVQVVQPVTPNQKPTYSTPSIFDRVIRGDISFTKVDGETGAHLGLIPFLVTSASTGEAHVIVTDKNGMASTSNSWNKHSDGTNVNDGLLRELENGGRIDSSHINPLSGMWFNGSAHSSCQVNNTLGALPYDNYHIEELPCTTNEGYSLASFDAYITREGIEINMGTIDDNRLVEPFMDTYLTHSNGLKLFTPDETTLISDTLYYTNLSPHESYIISGELHLVTEEGEDKGLLTTQDMEFTPRLPTGQTRVDFELNTTSLEGARIVAYETISDKAGNVLAVHQDPTYDQQTVYVDFLQVPDVPAPLEPDPNPEPNLEPDPEPIAEPDAEPDLKSKPEPKPEPDPEPLQEPEPESDPEPESSTEPDKNQEHPTKELPRTGDETLIIPLILIAIIALICLFVALKMKARKSTHEFVINKGPAQSEFEAWYRTMQENYRARESKTPESNLRL